ncbi:hypothetical protein [Catenuloplanes atrovinosus]|uniref:Uncharacterized protein n=1 Tax=Catenuloplanes atrovinosus TaxID=137266 RepID=A0AAE3YPN0_9ACTN|nr:hypothetical protein [Catenuloplanes atrovinosus]MDR7277370.1 hypothetical protein [Catenuloplanes atrovinosus]
MTATAASPASAPATTPSAEATAIAATTPSAEATAIAATTPSAEATAAITASPMPGAATAPEAADSTATQADSTATQSVAAGSPGATQPLRAPAATSPGAVPGWASPAEAVGLWEDGRPAGEPALALEPLPRRPATGTETVPGARPAPRWRLWLVPLVLIGVIVITAAALSGRAPTTPVPEAPVAEPPYTLGPPATGQVTIVTPSATPSAAPSSVSAAPSSAVPSRSASAGPTPSRTAPGAPPPAPAATRPAAANGPITGYSACTTGSAAVFAVTFEAGTFEWHHAYIDVDGNASTGYDVPDIEGRLGADYMVENDTYWRSNSAEWGWDPIENSGLQTSRTGTTFRWQVPRSALDGSASLRVVFNGSSDEFDAYTGIVTAASC